MGLAFVSAIEIPGYKIIKTLGVGGQATVYLAIQQGFDREVALKIMSPALAADPTFGERFIREAKIVAKLSHARIVTVYDVGESGSFYYLAMEYMRGEELKTQIAKGIKVKDTLVIIAKIAQVLHFAHKKGYVHRDVKSENILFDDNQQPVLTDFGIAKASNSSTQMTQTGKLIGTPEYMSPEQCRGRKLDGRSDLYSLGIILYEMMTRKVPFTGQDSVSVCIQHVTKPIPHLPTRHSHFQWLIDSLLAKNPDDRFQTGQELANAIKSFLANGDTGNRAVSKTTQTNISQVFDEPSSVDEFDDESFEVNDDFDVDQRINVQPETKSRVTLITTSLLLVIAAGTGYLSRDSWLPPVQKALGVEWVKTDGDFKEQGSIKTKPASEEPLNSGSSDSKKVKNATDRVKILIQQANTLAQYSPHELTDIQQALDNLITAKSLEPNNNDVTNTKNKIISIALQESVVSAEKNLFDNANQWLNLVQSADHDNSNLAATKQRVVLIKQTYDHTLSDKEKQDKQIANYLQLAEEALSENKLGAPSKDNAIYYYQAVLNLTPNDPRVKNGLNKVETKYIDLINQAVKKNKYAQAGRYLQELKNIPLIRSDLFEIENKVSQARQKYNAQQKEKQRLAAVAAEKQRLIKERQEKLADPLVQMQLQSNLQTAADLVTSGNLVEPNGNNALEKFQSALIIDPVDQTALNGVKNIEEMIITSIEVAISNQLEQSAESWIAKLRLFDAEHSKLNDYQLQLEELKLISDIEQQQRQVPDMPNLNGEVEIETTNNTASENNTGLENKTGLENNTGLENKTESESNLIDNLDKEQPNPILELETTEPVEGEQKPTPENTDPIS